jgi:uncharacterized protein YggE
MRSMPMAPGAQDRGITVTGNAVAHVAATSARVTINLSTRNGAAAMTEQSIAPIVDALVKAGADPNSISLPLALKSLGGLNNASIGGTVAKPTKEIIENGVVTVGSAITNVPGLWLSSALIQLKRDDCSTAQDQARKNAIEDAHRKALATAKQLGVQLGPVVAARINEQSQDDSCTTVYPLGGYGGPQMQSAQDYTTIDLTSYVTITYAIR